MLTIRISSLFGVAWAAPEAAWVQLDPLWAQHELGANTPATTVATLTLLNDAAEKSGAKCIDGTPAGFYYRPGSGTGAKKWYIHHEGGGWCTDLDDCLGRSNTALGSSTSYAPTGNLGGGYFSQDANANPMMYNWNSVYLKYCDGGSFSGFNASVTKHGGKELHFRGKAILNAMQQDLMGKGLSDATDVVISGCSAGGLATFLHADNWAALLQPQGAKVVAMPDSGFFLDYQAVGGDTHAGDCEGHYYHAGMKWVFEYMNSTSGVNQKCIDAHQATADMWKCIFAEHIAPHIATPTFPLQSEYDSWQTGCDLKSQDTVKVNAYGKNLTSLIEKNLLGANPKHGIFLDSCSHHCGGWGLYDVAGKNQPQAFQEWYEKGSTSLPNKGYYTQAQSFPCQDCCLPDPIGENIWYQATNPVMNRTGGVQGYAVVKVDYATDFGGLEYEGNDALLDGQPGLGTWWYAAGSFAQFSGGIPGPTIAGVNTVMPRVELYVWSDLRQAWVLMLRQTDGEFFSKDEFAKNKDNAGSAIYAALDDLEQHRSASGTFKLKMLWPKVGRVPESFVV